MNDTGKRLNLVFVGQRNFYTQYLVEWLNQIAEVTGVIWTASNRRSKAAIRQRLKKRCRRFGIFAVGSEVLYHVCMRGWEKTGTRELERLIEQARRELPPRNADIPAIEIPNLRDSQTHGFLTKCRPDVILAQCINEIIPKEVYALAKIGCFVYHEGMVPKYRGKYCTHWALLNGEFDQVGASLIKVDDGLDTGQVAFAEPIEMAPSRVECGRQNFWEHEVLFLALPRLRRWIEEASAGRVELADQGKVYPIYSYPRFSHIFKIGRRIGEYKQWLETRNDA